MVSKTKPEIILVGVKEYAEKWGLTRNAVYRRLERHLLTIYKVKGRNKLGLPKLNPDEQPPDLKTGPIKQSEEIKNQ